MSMKCISSSCIEPFVLISCSSSPFVTDIVLKFTLFDMSIATPDLFLFPFAWNVFFHPSLSVFFCLQLWRESLQSSIYIYWFDLFNQSSILCLLIGTSIDIYHDYWQVYTYCHFVTCFDAVFVVLSFSLSFFSSFRLFLYTYPWSNMEHHRQMLCIQWVCIILWSQDFQTIQIFWNRLQANLPKLCIKAKPCLNILDDNQICPSLKKHYISQGCFLYKCLWKDCSEQQAISALAHKICRNARDPGRTGSPKWEMSKNKERILNVYAGEN